MPGSRNRKKRYHGRTTCESCGKTQASYYVKATCASCGRTICMSCWHSHCRLCGGNPRPKRDT